MEVTKTKLAGCVILEPRVFEDNRGYFFESYNKKSLEDTLGDINFVQDNQSKSTYGVMRGLHLQVGEHAQAKLVRVLAGKVLDVAVDVRRDSPTYGEYVAVELSEENKRLFFIPRGFAHGFVVLTDSAIFSYKCDNYYAPHAESGILYNDSDLNIDWQVKPEDMVVSEKDQNLPTFAEFRANQ